MRKTRVNVRQDIGAALGAAMLVAAVLALLMRFRGKLPSKRTGNASLNLQGTSVRLSVI